MAQEFGVKRERDDKELFISKEKEYFMWDGIADKTLHLEAIMGAYTSVKHMFDLVSWKIESKASDEVIRLLGEINDGYRSIDPGGANDNWIFLSNLHKKVNVVYRKIKCGLKDY